MWLIGNIGGATLRVADNWNYILIATVSSSQSMSLRSVRMLLQSAWTLLEAIWTHSVFLYLVCCGSCLNRKMGKIPGHQRVVERGEDSWIFTPTQQWCHLGFESFVLPNESSGAPNKQQKHHRSPRTKPGRSGHQSGRLCCLTIPKSSQLTSVIATVSHTISLTTTSVFLCQ